MGSSQSIKEDTNVDVFMKLQKQVYTAGSKIQGNIYINAKKQIKYDALYLRLEGREYAQWTEEQTQINDQKKEKKITSYSNDKQSYLDQFIVKSFNGNLAPGHYAFPFTFFIPNQMAGSLQIDDHNFIKYTLKAYLAEKKNNSQPFSLVLNVVQPLRSPYGILRKEQTVNGFCCFCCESYGTTKIAMTCDKNFAITGDQIRVDAHVDTLQSTQKLKNCKFVLSTNYVKVSSDGAVRHSIIETHVLYAPQNNIVRDNSQENYSFTAKIPQNISRGTAIGNVLALWYTIDFISQQGYFNPSPPKCSLHLVINSRAPTVTKSPVVNPPPNWNPQVYQMLIYSNTKPYVYSPVQGIPVRNSAGTIVNDMQPGYKNMGKPPAYFISPPSEQNMMNKEY